MIYEKLTVIIDHYNLVKETSSATESITKGVLVKGSLKHLFEIFNQLRSENIIQNGSSFLDAGSGDGRICILANLFGLKTYGIEFNDEVFTSSLENIKELVKKGIVNKKLGLKIVQGDILDNQSYKDLQINFNEINVIFNYVTYHQEIANKIVNESNSGTIFILHSPAPISIEIPGLSLLKKIPISELFQEIYIFKKS